jgi:hypothetical protein
MAGGGDRPIERFLLRCDEGFQGNAVGDHKRAAVLLDETLLLEAREKPADGLPRSANHLSDLFVSQSHFHLAGVLSFGVLVKPSHQQAGKLFAGGVRKNEVTDFAAGSGIILADVLRHPQGKLTAKTHESQQIALT